MDVKNRAIGPILNIRSIMPLIASFGLVATTALPLPPPVAPYGLAPLPRMRVVVPMIFPVLGGGQFRDDYGQHRGRYLHTGIDIRAPKMTPIVAPFAGRIGIKRESFWIYGENGWRVLGTHLNDDWPGTNSNNAPRDLMFAPNLRTGDRVIAGQLIGYLGNSGNATGPHLHFELHGPKGIRNPKASLKMAQILRQPRFPLSNKHAVPKPGHERWEICFRAVNPTAERAQMIILARQLPRGRLRVDTSPNYASVKIPPGAFSPGQDWFDLQEYPKDRIASVYLRRTPTGFHATRVLMPPSELRAGPAPELAP